VAQAIQQGHGDSSVADERFPVVQRIALFACGLQRAAHVCQVRHGGGRDAGAARNLKEGLNKT
jgi:hypothetical protein